MYPELREDALGAPGDAGVHHTMGEGNSTTIELLLTICRPTVSVPYGARATFDLWLSEQVMEKAAWSSSSNELTI